MARFLFVVPPLVGHVNPAVGVAAELTARGHEVAWAGHDELLWQLAGPAALVFSCAVPPDLPPRPAGLKGPAALRFLWEDFLVPLGDAMAPGVAAALDAFQPHVVVADQQALAGGLLADAGGLPWVTSATTSAELVDPLSGMPKVADWVDGLLAGLRTRIAGGRGEADPRFSPHGVLAFTTRELLGAAELPPRIRLVGPALGPRPSTTDFPWAWLDPLRPTVLVSLGTANTGAGTEFLAATSRRTSWCGRASRSCRCWRGSTRCCATRATTPSAKRCGTACRWSWPRSATTSRSWRPRSWRPARACACASAARTPLVSRRRSRRS